MSETITLAVKEYKNKRLPELEGCYTCRAMDVTHGTRNVYSQTSEHERPKFRVRCTGCGRSNLWENDAFVVADSWNEVERGYLEGKS